MITISAFKWVPEFAQGQVRDLRARWALEEAGLPYKTRLLEMGDQDKPDYRALQPFGQVPILEEDGHVLFESGAIVLHIGERSEMLLPKDAGGRARATQWLIAALNSIEPFVMNIAVINLFYANEEWAKLRRPGAVEFVQKRLSALSKSLGDKPYLDGDRFTAGAAPNPPPAEGCDHRPMVRPAPSSKRTFWLRPDHSPTTDRSLAVASTRRRQANRSNRTHFQAPTDDTINDAAP